MSLYKLNIVNFYDKSPAVIQHLSGLSLARHKPALRSWWCQPALTTERQSAQHICIRISPHLVSWKAKKATLTLVFDHHQCPGTTLSWKLNSNMTTLKKPETAQKAMKLCYFAKVLVFCSWLAVSVTEVWILLVLSMNNARGHTPPCGDTFHVNEAQ